MKAKYVFNKPIELYDGTKSDLSLGKIIANAILSTSQAREESEILKFALWALDLGKHEEVELDEADVVKLKKFITEAPSLLLVHKATAISILNDSSKK